LKILITIFSLISFSAIATTEKTPCRPQAHEAAYKTYIAQRADSTIFTKSKFKPTVEGNSITYIIQILDQDNGNDEFVVVTLEKNLCKVLEIN